MTEEYLRRKENFTTNASRIIGMLRGNAEFFGEELKKDRSYWSNKEIGEKLVKSAAMADKWFDVAFDKVYEKEEIEAMMESKPSDIVELERA